MAIDSVSNSSSAATATSKAASALGGGQDTQDRFIKMLVAQLQNQDPLNPMDNSQVTSQMAQLNTVQGIQNLNSTMQTMASSFGATASLQATSMLGRTVMSEGNAIGLNGGAAKAAIDMGQSADQVTVEIKNAAGQVVSTQNLGATQSGLHAIEWDGTTDAGAKAPDGNYTFTVKAKAAGQDAKVTPMTVNTVQGVSQASDGVKLLTASGSELKLTDVKRIF